MAVIAGREAEARAIRRDSICQKRLAVRTEDVGGRHGDTGRTSAVAGLKCSSIGKLRCGQRC